MSSSKTSTSDNRSQALSSQPETEEKVLCPHCRRTASNGLKCIGKCVADSDY